MEKLPLHITIVFLATVALNLFLLLTATRQKRLVAIVTTLWLVLTGVVAAKDFFQSTSSMPPRLAFAMLPAIAAIVISLVTKKGRQFVDGLDLKTLTLLHVVRLPVELVLYWLAVQKTIPELMTFTGRNFDILSGISAPLMVLICFRESKLVNRKSLLTWNFICLALLLNIVVNALLSVPSPLQQFAFDQPNIAVLYFPFTWLPVFIVTSVLFSHLAAIRQLRKSGNPR